MALKISTQKRLDDLAARFQLFNKWSRILKQEKDPVKAEKLNQDIKKYIEPVKLHEEMGVFFDNLSDETQKSYGARDIASLLLKHKPTPGLSESIGDLGFVFLTLAGVALIIVGVGFAGGIVAYAFGVNDADKILAKNHPEYFLPKTAIGSVTILGLVATGVYLLTRKRRSAS